MKRVLWLIGISMALATLACGPQAQSQPASATDGQPKSGGVLNIDVPIYYTNLDPTQGLRSEATYVTSRFMDSLLGIKTGPDVKYEEIILEPNLAERWEVAPDGKTFTFHLRKGVKFHNLPPVNGREMTSADVKWSFEYIARIGQFKGVKFPRSNQIDFKLYGVNRIETPDTYTVVVHFNEPFAPFMTYVGTSEVAVMAHEVYDAGLMNERPIGTGPYIADLEAWQAGARMVAKKNPDYWDRGKPYLDEIRNLVIVDEGTAMAAFQAKQLDVYAAPNLEQTERLLASARDAKYLRTVGWTPYRVYYNVKVPPFNDVKFRRAISLATDREEFVRIFTKGQGRWGMDGGLPMMFTEEEVKKLVPYDPEQAKRLLKEIGYADNPITIETLWSTGYAEQTNLGNQLMQAQWKKVGIEMLLVGLDRTDMSNRRRIGNYMMAPGGGGGAGALEPDPDLYMWTYFHPDSGANYYQVNDPKLTAYADGQRRELDPIKRMERWREQAKYVAEMGYALWIFNGPGYYFWHPYVKGYYPHIVPGAEPVLSTWLDK